MEVRMHFIIFVKSSGLYGTNKPLVDNQNYWRIAQLAPKAMLFQKI